MYFSTWLYGRIAEELAGCDPEAFAGVEDEISAMGPRPARSLVDRFAMISLCCGGKAPLLTACAEAGLKVGPRVDLEFDKLWDLMNSRVVEWLLILIWEDNLWWTSSETPCATFSVAPHPRLRSKEAPLGFDPLGETTAIGNWLLVVGICCRYAHLWSGNGHGGRERPKSAYSWAWPAWGPFLRHPDCGRIHSSMCCWEMPYQKHFLVQRGRAQFCEVLNVQCQGGREHVILQGALTTAAAEYPPARCEAWAEAARTQYDAEHTEEQIDVREEKRLQRRGECEMMWLNEFVASA
jgi:hypothetical protein